jgi:hypothetical protein
MSAIRADASSTDVGTPASVLATALPGPFASSLGTDFGAAICDQLVSQVPARRQVSDAPLRILDCGESLLDLNIGHFGRVGHSLSLPGQLAVSGDWVNPRAKERIEHRTWLHREGRARCSSVSADHHLTKLAQRIERGIRR